MNAVTPAERLPRILTPSEPAESPVVVSAVIPCLNEERTIARCIRKAFASFAELSVRGEVVVADNGSTDGSVEIATKEGARVVHEPRRGYGATLLRGIGEARGDIIVMADADDSYDWAAIPHFVRKIREGYDLVMGNRFRGRIEHGAMPVLHRYLGNPVLSWIARTAFRTKIGDFHCGMRAFTRTAFRAMQLKTTGMEFATEMVAHAAHQRLRIAEIPVILRRDGRNRPPHLRSFRDGWRHLRFIITYAPDHVYLVPGLLMFLLGTALDVLLINGPVTIGGVYLGIHFLALASLLTLAGFNVVNLGVLAKTLMASRYAAMRSGILSVLGRRRSLESGLGLGLALMVLGAAVDISMVRRWIAFPHRGMDSSVDLSFVATTALVLGLNMVFTSLLLNLIHSECEPSEP